jgi:hypothetical protein
VEVASNKMLMMASENFIINDYDQCRQRRERVEKLAKITMEA